MTLDLLRFTTAGSVDDGKSTLIGRLLYDTKQVFEDQLEHVAEASMRRGGEGVLDLALLTDGLRAEREQGITIDVAYRYFATARRRFIIADCPGHQQYTRNMVTGASTADLAVILLDARKGVLEQSKRHAFISVLLGIPHLVVAVNKMDLVDYSRARFEELVGEFESFAQKLSAMPGVPMGSALDLEGERRAGPEVTYIPISALEGDNVVDRSQRMDWYQDPARQPVLLELLEEVDVAYDHPYDRPARFPVQWVIRPAQARSTVPAPAAALSEDYRGYAGQLASGALRVGEDVVALPSGQRTRIAAIDTYEGTLEEALAPMSVTLRLEDELDVSRGELICRPEQSPTVARELRADVCWLNARPLRPGARYVIKHTTRSATAIVDALEDRVDVHTLERAPAPAELELNDIGSVRLRTSAPLAFDPYVGNRRTGSFILIDEATNETVGAGMVASATG
ncbi:MAG TPA: GTP-binding protein [Solirubrobacteraceae bacterium]|jgi:sulfate adenylyltransferase large subunit|nr:GTP-binding protein [Solirubrobacteraceae bacterium]